MRKRSYNLLLGRNAEKLINQFYNAAARFRGLCCGLRRKIKNKPEKKK